MSQITELETSYAEEPKRSEWVEAELRRTLLAGFIGAVVAAAAYFIYSRLEDEQKEALRQTVGKFVGEKIADIRSQFNF
jgi:hypothetical protein